MNKPRLHRPAKIFCCELTLIELIMIVVVLGVLSSAAVSKFIESRNEARLSGIRKIGPVSSFITAASAANLSAVNAGDPTGVPVMSNRACEQPIMSSHSFLNSNMGSLEGYELHVDAIASQDCSRESGNSSISCLITDNISKQSMPVMIYCAIPPAL